jgi:hypothetical protein
MVFSTSVVGDGDGDGDGDALPGLRGMQPTKTAPIMALVVGSNIALE